MFQLKHYLSCLLTLFLSIFPLLGSAQPYFRDVTDAMKLDFRHINGFSAERRLVETMGSGGALFDFDNDDDLDLYLVQGNSLSVSTEPPPKNRLYRNDGGIFVDITESANVGDTGYGLGAVAADYDGDGNRDLYITNLGKNVLYRNNGDGTFTNVTEQAQVGCPLLSASAAFADIDRDGDLDLYVCNYVEYALETDIPCYYKNTLRIYCGPNEYHGIADVLYRNNGDGTFTDITKSAGVYEPTTRGLGVVFTDVNNNGWVDIYVANDMSPNTLFMNQGDGTFREEGVLRGVAFNGDGIANGSMGIDAGDYDNDGDIDLWVSNFSLEANCLMQNDGSGYFEDVTFDTNLADPSFYSLGFGTRFIDFDNDGWLDLLVGNGHIWDNVEQIDAKMSYAQPVQLFRNRGGTPQSHTGFTEITAEAGLDKTHYVVRGMLFGDIDRDGDVDVVLCQSNRPTVILSNEVGNANAWLTVKLVGTDGNTDAIGAQVQLEAGGMTFLREVICGASYLSGNDLRICFGLGDATRVDNLQIRWHNGSTQKLEELPIRQSITFSQH
ncbi:MAG: CRTAC1 family protein [Candidatus Poribacteria bacterium]|nr:CRTAC1 family protein [Candidatus Poribacteria bacterium]